MNELKQQGIMNQTNRTISLEKAYTFFMVPFYYQGNEWEDIRNKKLGKWHLITKELYNKEDVLYPYIMDLFKQGNEATKTRLEIYEFESKDTGPSSQLFVDRILGKKNVAVIAKNASAQKNPVTISFTLKKDGNFAPHIFVSPSARIGILTFAIELDESKDIDSLKQLNYNLQKRDEIDKYQCVCLRPEKQEELVSTDEMYKAACNIPDLWKKNKWGKKECSQSTTRSNVDFISWDFNDFIDCLLATMGKPQTGKPRLKYFSQDRIHTFTFCSIDDPQNLLDEKAITPDLLRLSRSVVDDYMLPFDLMVQQGAVLKTYENIFFSSATEGTAMLCIAKPENKSFITNIHNIFNRQYFLIYILVIIQRYTLLSFEKRLTELESASKDSDDDLWSLIDVICRIKVNCYYTDVSIYTHHSQFYQHCCKNLHIQETYNEIDEKLELLKITTDRKIQIALEKQRILQEEEAKKREEEIKRQQSREEEEERRRKLEKEKAERRQYTLNWIVAILTFIQALQAIFVLKNEVCWVWFQRLFASF